MFRVTGGTNNGNVLEINRTLVLRYIKKLGVCSRSQISEELGLTPASISKIVNILLKYNIVKETGFITGLRGKRSIGIALNDDIYRVIGLRLARRRISAGVFDLEGNQIESIAQPINEESSVFDIVEKMKALIDNYLSQYHDIVSIGIAVPGPFKKKDGRIVVITEMGGTTEKLRYINFNQEFSNYYDIPVIIEHDANAGALADWWFGCYRKHDTKSMVHFLVDEGVGAGLISEGYILEGSQGIAGEIGHISVDVNGERCKCGNYGCLEMYCSTLAVLKQANEKLQQGIKSQLSNYSNLKMTDIISCSKTGDPLAIELLEQAAEYIGYGIVNIVNAYDPDVVIIEGGLASAGEMLLSIVRKIAKQRVPKDLIKNVTIELSDFTIDPILLGSAAMAVDYFIRNPSVFIKEDAQELTD